MSTITTWALLFAILPGGQQPIPEIMERNTVKDLSACVQLASVKWIDYYQWNPPHTNFFTYCLESRDRDRYTRLISVKCNRDGICSMKGVKDV